MECQTAFEEVCTYLATIPLLTRPVEGEMVYLYLAIFPVIVSSILIWEDEGMQKLVYDTSKLLKDMETRYPKMERSPMLS